MLESLNQVVQCLSVLPEPLSSILRTIKKGRFWFGLNCNSVDEVIILLWRQFGLIIVVQKFDYVFSVVTLGSHFLRVFYFIGRLCMCARTYKSRTPVR